MSTYYNFVQLDPRPQAENPEYQFGIEVMIPVPDGITNLDHHGPEATAETPAACEQALTCELPPEGATIATVRPDADSVTAMAVLASRAEGRYVNPDLVYAIGLMDRYGPRVESSLKFRGFVVAIARRATDFKVPLAERVTFIQACLDGTADVDEAAKLVTEREAEYEAALEASKVHVIIANKLAYVESTHRFATTIGYQKATTVVAFNPEMPRKEGGAYRKYTVCRWDSNVLMDMDGALAELRELENGWGGRGDIFGSPQNQNSRLSPVQVVSVVTKYVDTVGDEDYKQDVAWAGMFVADWLDEGNLPTAASSYEHYLDLARSLRTGALANLIERTGAMVLSSEEANDLYGIAYSGCLSPADLEFINEVLC